MVSNTAVNIKSKQTKPTINISVILRATNAMVERGKEFVTNMYQSILFVSCATKKEYLFPRKKYITSYHYQRVERMKKVISLLFVSHAMQKFMQSVEIIKAQRKIVCIATTTDPYGYKNLQAL